MRVQIDRKQFQDDSAAVARWAVSAVVKINHVLDGHVAPEELSVPTRRARHGTASTQRQPFSECSQRRLPCYSRDGPLKPRHDHVGGPRSVTGQEAAAHEWDQPGPQERGLAAPRWASPLDVQRARRIAELPPSRREGDQPGAPASIRSKLR